MLFRSRGTRRRGCLRYWTEWRQHRRAAGTHYQRAWVDPRAGESLDDSTRDLVILTSVLSATSSDFSQTSNTVHIQFSYIPVDFETHEPGNPRVDLSEGTNARQLLAFLLENTSVGYTPVELADETGIPRGSIGRRCSGSKQRASSVTRNRIGQPRKTTGLQQRRLPSSVSRR